MKKSLITIIAVLMCVALFAGCAAPAAAPASEAPASEAPASEAPASEAPASEAPASEAPASEAPASEAPAAAIEAPPGKTLLSVPVDKSAEKPLKIATVMVQNNPFGAAVLVGQNFSKKILADKNATVDCISVEDFDAQKWASTLENLVATGYDAICYFGLSEALAPVTQSGKDAGILMLAFNTPVGDPNVADAFYGQDGFAGGQKCGQALIDAMGGEGEYGIITGDFSVLGHELRRTGARDVLDKNDKMKLVGEFENNDKAEEAYTVATNLITANPNLKGIYVTAGGPSGAAKAIEDAGKAGEIKLVCHDVLAEIAPYIANGTVSACLDQDPFNQGYQPVIDAYNKLVDGKEIPAETWYEGVIATPETVKDLFPELF